MKNKDTKYIINDKIRDIIKNKYDGYEAFLASKTRMQIKSIQKGERNMSEMEKQNKKLIALYSIGTEIHEELKRKGTENKQRQQRKRYKLQNWAAEQAGKERNNQIHHRCRHAELIHSVSAAHKTSPPVKKAHQPIHKALLSPLVCWISVYHPHLAPYCDFVNSL